MQTQPLPTPPALIENPAPLKADLFNGAHILNDGGNINTTVANAVYYYSTIVQSDSRGRDKLQPVIAIDATHGGNVRADPLGCHPETCQAIISDIVSWIELAQREKNILWLFGPAGIGKSAIAKSTADRLDEKGSIAKVAGSFFFWRGDPSRNSLHHFVPTLAYQLTVFDERVGVEIDRVIDNHPLVLSTEIGVQWRKLIVEPVKAVFNVPPAAIILDGLDECGDEKDQRKVLDLISSCGPDFPFAFLVTGRPETHLQNAFKSQTLSALCRDPINLSECRNDDEMQIFIRSSFSAIYNQHRDILECYSSESAWPSPDVICDIIDNAQGQYIYPVTLFKYINEDGINPHERLQEFLQEEPGTFSPLDRLYMQVLRASHSHDDEQMQDLLFIISSGLDFNPGITVPTMVVLIGIESPQLRLRLRKLHSVLSVPTHDAVDSWISCHHRSFSDFLLDPRRSGDYYINQMDHAIRIVGRCLSTLAEGKCREEDFVSLMVIWWACSDLLPRAELPDSLLKSMEKFDLYGPLETMRLGHFQKAAYNTFVKVCRRWGILSLRNKYEGDTDKIVKTAHWLKLHFLCLWQNCQSCFGERNEDGTWTSGKKWDRSDIHEYANAHVGTCPLSWPALIALAKAYRNLWGLQRGSSFDVLTRDKFVQLSLKLLCSEDLIRMLSDADLLYLSTWSRAWLSYP
ncbi:hypothetical protein AX16_008374 [Volvariella volvacea WC 439]|nr:hypothetical protein AX16_008374 [Volvariella volvacea WC 439]